MLRNVFKFPKLASNYRRLLKLVLTGVGGFVLLMLFMAWGESLPKSAMKSEDSHKTSERFESCRSNLKMDQQIGLLHDLQWSSVLPRVVVGPTYYKLPFKAKQEFADRVNCFVMAGQNLFIDFELFDWQSGKAVAQYHLGQLKSY